MTSNTAKSDREHLNQLIHFLRTPVTSIKLGSDILKAHLPKLFDDAPDEQQKMQQLTNILEGIAKEAQRIDQYINTIEQERSE